MPTEIKLEINELEKFVAETYKKCSYSHSDIHMKIYKNSLELCRELNIFNASFLLILSTVTWLHDIDDCKYSDTKNFLQYFTNKYAYLIEEQYMYLFNAETLIDIIEKINFQYQKKNPNEDNYELGELGIQILNIASDADKLEIINLKRYNNYYTEQNPKLSSKEIYKLIETHYHTKLKYIYPQYLKTVPAKVKGAKLNREMSDELKILKRIMT